MKKQLTLLFFAICFSTSIFGQVQLTPTVISSGGGFGENDNLSISWTLGEVAVNTLTGDQMILTQGFQQPFAVAVGLEQEEANRGISVYPNPVGDELQIQFDIEKRKGVILEIQDVSGRVITRVQNEQVNSGDIIYLNTSSFKPGVYVLSILAPDRQERQVFSVLKL